jgi:Flp pilus assembly protein TadG
MAGPVARSEIVGRSQADGHPAAKRQTFPRQGRPHDNSLVTDITVVSSLENWQVRSFRYRIVAEVKGKLRILLYKKWRISRSKSKCKAQIMIGSFIKNTGGNFALIAAVSVVPLMMAIGLGTDFMQASKQRAEMQRALDSAALTIAQRGNEITDDEARILAVQFLGSNFNKNFSILKLLREGTTVELAARTPHKMIFGGLFGKKSVDIQVRAAADVSGNTHEIAFVLGTAGTMYGGKLTILQGAVNDLITTMASQLTQKDSLKFALVPFSTFVNVGPQFGPKFDESGKMTSAGASWLDTFGRNPTSKVDLPRGMSRFYAYDFLGSSWPGCVETRLPIGINSYDVMDIAPNAKTGGSLFVPSFNPDEPDDIFNGSPKYPNNFLKDGVAGAGQGTVSERATRYGILSYTGPDGIDIFGEGFKVPSVIWNWPSWIASWVPPAQDNSPSNYFPDYSAPKGPEFRCSSKPIVALTDKFEDIRKAVADLDAAGSTNILEGVMWGWRILSSREPFAEGRKEKTARNRKIMVVLTDASNSLDHTPNALGSAYGSFGYLVEERLAPAGSSSTKTTAALDAKTIEGCKNAKQDGIEIFTITLEIDEKETKKMLRDCASDDEHFFDLSSRNQLKETLFKIKDRIVRLRLAG